MYMYNTITDAVIFPTVKLKFVWKNIVQILFTTKCRLRTAKTITSFSTHFDIKSQWLALTI